MDIKELLKNRNNSNAIEKEELLNKFKGLSKTAEMKSFSSNILSTEQRNERELFLTKIKQHMKEKFAENKNNVK